ncbi:MAG: GlsB/YeaQ/YmgE family stress response membrane protein [Firmicutes bacterium]|nr:GlsB/YeaQ/YmgE family stress response membrane protein [Bacillota bacterium]
MGIFAWLLFGALVGWLASIIMGKNRRMGLIANIIVGIVGSVIGGWLGDVLNIANVQAGFTFRGIAMAVLGAVLLLFVLNLFSKKR